MRKKRETESFFTWDRGFYRSLFSLFTIVVLQNLAAYSVNMADNIMLGGYDQTALSGAATVNQIFFLVQQLAMAIGEGLTVLTAQYWGQGRVSPIRRLTGTALKWGAGAGTFALCLCFLLPRQLVGIFTSDQAIVAAGVTYLRGIEWTFPLFIVSQILVTALRSVEVVWIGLWTSLLSLAINVGVNYTLIFGHFGAPELGLQGAAIGTLLARIAELLAVVWYLAVKDQRLKLFSENFLRRDPGLERDFLRIAMVVVSGGMCWAISVPLQTAVLGHLPGGVSSDAIAANSVATTFYQYLKVFVIAMSASSSVLIGKTVGQGDLGRLRKEARTLSVLDVVVGLLFGALLFLLRKPLLSLYSLRPSAMKMADQLIVVMSVVMVGMAYQMPVSGGILRAGGDTRFTTGVTIISTWCIVMPLSYLSGYVWKLPVWAVVCFIQSDQIFKGLPIFLRFRTYKWVKKLTRPEDPGPA